MSVNSPKLVPIKNEPVKNETKQASPLKAEENLSIFSFDSNTIASTELDNSETVFDFSEFDTIPDGYSHYEYNGSTLDIYKTDDDYQSQFIHPEDISKEDFYNEFPNLEPIVPSQDTDSPEANKTVAGVNGKIDENTIQGATGDCWVISALYSMCNSEQGKNIISNAIKVNDDNTVTVSFAGAGVSYTMTPEEIAQFDTDNNTSDEYSNGDNDVLVMELAVQKLWKDINDGNVKLNTNNKDLLFAGKNGITDGGLPSQLIYYLTGVEPKQLYNKDLSNLSKSQITNELQNAYQSGNTSLTFGLYGNGHNAKLINGENFDLDLGKGGHAMAVTEVTKDTVTFVNPWDTSKKYTMSWDEFSKLGVGYMSSSDLTKTNPAKEIVDKTSASNYIYKNESNDYSSSRSHRRRGSNYSFDNDSNSRGSGINKFIDYFEELIKDLIDSDNEARRMKKKEKSKIKNK